MKGQVTTFYLEMTHPCQLRPKRVTVVNLRIEQATIPCPELNRFLYRAVGGNWFWIDKLHWTYQQWSDFVGRANFQTWVAYLSGTPCGYFELELQNAGNVEIVSFGLLPQFIGKGLGGHLLTECVERAWASGAQRVWLHTCSLDHPTALKNYLARGFKIYKQIEELKELPDQTPGPWTEATKK